MPNFDMQTLLRNMERVVTDSERLLDAVAGEANEDIVHARRKAEQSLKNARAHLGSSKLHAMRRARELTRSARQRVQNQPWQTLSIAAGVGVLVGLLWRRR